MIAAIAISSLLVAPVMAQLRPDKSINELTIGTATAASADLTDELASMRPSALQAVDQNRASIIDTLVNHWASELSAGSDKKAAAAQIAELRESLSSLRADQLMAASHARTLIGLRHIFGAADAAQASEKAKQAEKHQSGAQKTLGSSLGDLVYTPIPPCKLVDTRSPGTGYYYPAGGAFAASQKRTYDAYLGCGSIPSFGVRAIQVSVNTQYGGAGGGILSMMANGAAAPVTNIFYSGYAPVTTVILLSNNLFDAQISGVAGADLIVDVVGFFAAPEATALQCQSITGPSTMVAAGAYRDLGTVTCPVVGGWTAISAGIITIGDVVIADNAQAYVAGGNGNAWRMAVKNTDMLNPRSVVVTVACCRIPGR
jgi:hypothetical protein